MRRLGCANICWRWSPTTKKKIPIEVKGGIFRKRVTVSRWVMNERLKKFILFHFFFFSFEKFFTRAKKDGGREVKMCLSFSDGRMDG